MVFVLVATCAFASPVPDTGQTKCYNVDGNVIACPLPGQPFYGQDGNYIINPMSYAKLDSIGSALPDSATSWAMVRDNVTGLIWESKTNDDGKADYNNPHDADNLYTWYDNNLAIIGSAGGTPGNGTDTEDFIKQLNDANFGGYADWRLPTIKELAYLIDYSLDGPTINTMFFPNIQSTYWSTTTDAYDPNRAWGIHFSYGSDYYDSKAFRYSARAVRGGQSVPSGYHDNGDGTVTDASTGLIWQQNSSNNTMTWEQALSYCEGLSLGGNNNWRLPTDKELRSLVDYSRYNPALNTTYFLDSASCNYWSSTATATSYYPSIGWILNFCFGYDGVYNKSEYINVRAVRSDEPQMLQVGAGQGLEHTKLAANQMVELNINSTNSHGDTTVFEWFLLTAFIGGNSIPVYVMSDNGIFDLNQVWPNLYAYTYSFDTDGVTFISRLSMSDLGLIAGDTLIYAYAYMNPSYLVVIDNVVIIAVE